MPIVTVADMIERARGRIGAMKIAPCTGIVSSQAAAREFEMALDALEHISEHWTIIDQLRAPEGAEVVLFCDNPDMLGANNAIEVCDHWTNWKYTRFEGDTILDALRAALKASKGEAGG